MSIPARSPLPILHQDDHLVAISKPSGLLVHRSDIDRRETRFAVQVLRDQLGRPVWPGHRLDRATSGVLLFALDADTSRALTRAFEQRAVDKHYLAVVRGHPPLAGVIDHPLARVEDDYAGGAPAGAQRQPALTRYTRLAVAELPVRVDRYPTSRYALLGLTPETGRRHQLRRHLKHLAHPIVGDTTYGKSAHNRLFAERFGVQRLLLHCAALSLAHPVSGVPLRIAAPPGDELLAVFRGLGWAEPDWLEAHARKPEAAG